MLRLPPPIWALIFLGLCAALSWAMGWPPGLGPYHVPLGIVLFLVGWILPVWAVGRFRQAGTELNPASQTNRALVTDGPFRLTRNPMYLGLTVSTLGAAIWIGPWPMLLAPVAVFATANFVHIPFEEAKMRLQFGEAFDAYAGRVRRWL